MTPNDYHYMLVEIQEELETKLEQFTAKNEQPNFDLLSDLHQIEQCMKLTGKLIDRIEEIPKNASIDDLRDLVEKHVEPEYDYSHPSFNMVLSPDDEDTEEFYEAIIADREGREEYNND